MKLSVTSIFIGSKNRSNGLRLYARFSDSQSAQTRDLFTSRLQIWRTCRSLWRILSRHQSIQVLVELSDWPKVFKRLSVLVASGLQNYHSQETHLAGIPSQLQLGLLSPLYLRKLFERLGATYIKLGQYCFGRAPVVPFDEIKRILREELAAPIDSIYEYVDSTPLASASIAQVHAA